MITISNLIEYSKSDIATNRLSTAFLGMRQMKIPQTMLKKAASAEGRKRDALVHGAKNILKTRMDHRLK